MKTTINLTIILLALNISLSRAAEPQGLLVYSNTGDLSNVRFDEFAKYIDNNPRNFPNMPNDRIIRADGGGAVVFRDGILGRFNYPPKNGPPINEELAKSTIQKIQELQRSFGRQDLTHKLDGALARWQEALEVALEAVREAAKARQATIPPESPGILLEVKDDRVYQKVKLKTVTDDAVTIQHREGAARIPLSSLSPSQIAALNRTNPKVHIDPDWEAKKEALTKLPRLNAFSALFFLTGKAGAGDRSPGDDSDDGTSQPGVRPQTK